MTVVWARWYGGGRNHPPDNLERFNSIAAARTLFKARLTNTRVGVNSETLLFARRFDNEPFIRMYVGPRGGVRTEPC